MIVAQIPMCFKNEQERKKENKKRAEKREEKQR